MNKFNAPLSTRVMAYLLIGLSFLAILSCRKEIINLVRDPIAMAHEQFDQKAKQTTVEANGNSMLSNNLLLKRQPDWKRAFIQKSGDSTFVFVPIDLPANLTLKVGGKQGTHLNDLMLLRMSDTGKGFDADHAEMITLLPEVEWKQGHPFQGKLIIENWFVPDRHFASLSPKTNSGGITAFGLVECVTTIVDECIGAGDGETCTPNSQTTCVGYGDGGGGGGGGVPSTPPASGGSHSGGTGSAPKDIKDSLGNYPCASALLAQLPTLKNDIARKIDSTFNGNADMNITFVSAALSGNLDGDHTINAITMKNGYNYNDGFTFQSTIRISQDVLNYATKEYILATMYHESLHAFLNVEKTRLGLDGFQAKYPDVNPLYINGPTGTIDLRQTIFVAGHSVMGNNFVDKLASALKSFNPSLSTDLANAMAAAGILKLSPTASTLNANERDVRKNNYSGTKCP